MRSNILDGLSVVTVNIDTDNCMVEFRVGALKDFVVSVFFVVKSIQSFENEFENSN